MPGPNRSTNSEITYDAQSDALFADLTRHRSYEELLHFTRELADELQQRQCRRLYVDARHIGIELTAMQSFHLVAAVADRVPAGLHVSVAGRPAHRVLIEIAQLAARLRGVKLELFGSPREALAWLT